MQEYEARLEKLKKASDNNGGRSESWLNCWIISFVGAPIHSMFGHVNMKQAAFSKEQDISEQDTQPATWPI